MGSWKMNILLGKPIFRGELLVSGRVKCRGSPIFHFSDCLLVIFQQHLSHHSAPTGCKFQVLQPKMSRLRFEVLPFHCVNSLPLNETYPGTAPPFFPADLFGTRGVSGPEPPLAGTESPKLVYGWLKLGGREVLRSEMCTGVINSWAN